MHMSQLISFTEFCADRCMLRIEQSLLIFVEMVLCFRVTCSVCVLGGGGGVYNLSYVLFTAPLWSRHFSCAKFIRKEESHCDYVIDLNKDTSISLSYLQDLSVQGMYWSHSDN